MKINSGELIKNLRREIGVSQEELADRLYMNQRSLSRIETGETEIDVWRFMSFMELLGMPTEDFWLMYLDTQEYDDYRMYKQIKNLLWKGELAETKELVEEFENRIEGNKLSKHGFVRQFIAYVKTATDETISDEQAIENLIEAMCICRPNFDESKVAEYHLTYNEINILGAIAVRASKIGNIEQSINLYKALIDNRENIKASDEDMWGVIPNLMSGLTTLLGRAKRYKESLDYCNKALEASRKSGYLLTLPGILVNMASGYQLIGEPKEVYLTYLYRAYQCALAFGDERYIKSIKKTAEKSFGIKDLQELIKL